MIKVKYKDFAEMQAVARQILGLDSGSADEPKAFPAPDAKAAPVAPMPAAAPVQTVQPAVPVASTPTMAVPAPATAAPAPAAPIPAPVPTTEPAYTLDDLARAGMTLMDTGRPGEVIQLLARFGVDALPALPKSQYGAFATALREMGAQI